MKKRKIGKKYDGMVENTSAAEHAANVINTIILCGVIFITIIPMWHVLMSSISDGQTLFAHEGLVIKPLGGINFGGYDLVLKDSSIIRAYLVTIFYVVATSSFGLVLNVLGGYVLSWPTKLKPFLIGSLVFTLLFNGGLIPTYMIIRNLGLTGTPWAIILPGCTNAMFMIMMMNAFLQVPKSTVEAAKMDGAGHFIIMFRVMLPQAKGMALVTVINAAIMAWNAWFEASIYVPTKKQWWPLQLWVRELTSKNQDFLNFANPNYNRFLVQFVVIVIATLPIVILFPFFQKRLEENMYIGGVKG